MPEFLNEKGLSHYLDSIIAHARERVLLVSPFLCIPESLITKINIASSRNVDVTIIHGIRDQFKPYEQERLDRLEKVELLFHPRLHAKAYLNEREAIVTSLNLSDAAEDNRSHEFGVYFTWEEQPKMFEALVNECRVILHEITSTKHSDFKVGYCIRCRGEIPLDANRPLCISCYQIWKTYNNPNYVEKFCHWCGVSAQTSLNRPNCQSH